MKPRERQRLVALLRAATSSGADAVQAWRSLPPDFDLDEIWDRDLGRLLGSIGRNLADAGAEIPELPRLRGFQRKWWVEQQMTARWLDEWVPVLTGAGIGAWVTGGLAWSVVGWGYADRPGVRWPDDTRLLVRRGDVADAQHALTAAGASGLPSDRLARRIRLHAETPLRLGDRWTSLGWLPSPGLAQAVEWWEDTTDIEIGRCRVGALDQASAFVARCGDLEAGIGGASGLVDLCRVHRGGVFDSAAVEAVAERWLLSRTVRRWSAIVDRVLDHHDEGWVDAIAPAGQVARGARAWRTTASRLGRRQAVVAGPDLLAERWHLSGPRELPAGFADRVSQRLRRQRAAT